MHDCVVPGMKVLVILLCRHACVALSCVYGSRIVRYTRALYRSSDTCVYRLDHSPIGEKGAQYMATKRAFAEALSTNPDMALADLQGVDLSLYVDAWCVESVSQQPWILEQLHAQQLAQQRAKPAWGGPR
jgi:hypothetical protein